MKIPGTDEIVTIPPKVTGVIVTYGSHFPGTDLHDFKVVLPGERADVSRREQSSKYHSLTHTLCWLAPGESYDVQRSKGRFVTRYRVTNPPGQPGTARIERIGFKGWLGKQVQIICASDPH